MGPVLRVLAEAGFFCVIYATAAVVLGHHPPFLGPIEFSLLVGAGAVIGRIARQNPEIGAFVLIAAVVGGGALGWLASPDARALVADQPIAALGNHGIGWLAAFVVLRGAFIHGATAGAGDVEQLLRWLLPFAAWLWALATVLAPPLLWPSFAVYALWGSLTMIVAGLAAIGIVRLGEVHAGLKETRVRRLWRWLVLAAAISVVPLAMPFIVLAGIPLGMVLAPIAEPLLFVIALLALPFALFVGWLLNLFPPILYGVPPGYRKDVPAEVIHEGQRVLRDAGPAFAGTVIGLALATIVIVVLAVAIYALAHWMLRRDPYADSGGATAPDALEHAIVVPTPDPPRTRRSVRPRRSAAHDAVTAYVSAVDALADHPDWARAAYETPAQHALRVRVAEMPGATDLSRLAADYQLARYGERQISPTEDRRAISRLGRLRRLLR